MEVTKINPITAQNKIFTGNNKITQPVKHFQLQKIQKTTNQTSLPNLSPAYFHPSFTAKFNIEIEKTTKEIYNRVGLPYLLPHEIWSDNKILNTMKWLGKKLDKLEKSNALNKKTLQDTINKILPKRFKDRIIIKDLVDLEKDLKNQGYSKDEIKLRLECNATIGIEPNETILYFNFAKATVNKKESVDLKSYIEHEMDHALKFRTQNTLFTDIYKNNYGEFPDQNKIFNIIFSQFESNYIQTKLSSESTKLKQENMLEAFKFKSVEDLHNSFETVFNKLIEEAKSSKKFNIGFDLERWKQFFVYLKHSANSEKEAYQSTIRYRELNGNLNTPTKAELIPLLYAEMEKFFAEKESMISSRITSPN